VGCRKDGVYGAGVDAGVGWEVSGGLELERDSTLYGCYVALHSFEHRFGFGWTLPTPLTEPSTVHHRILLSYGTLCTFGDISTPLYALIRVLPLQRRLSGCRATLARRCIVGHDSSVQGNGPRSLFCRLVSSVVSSNSEGAGSLDSRTEVVDVDGVDCWGSAKTRETLICAGSCFKVARYVCLELLFGGGGSNQLHFGTSSAWSTLNSTKSREVSSSMEPRPQIKEVKGVFLIFALKGCIRFDLSTVHASHAYFLVVYHPNTLVFHCT